MGSMPTQLVLLISAAIVFLGGLSVLRVLAIYRQREIDAHDLALRARQLYEDHVNSRNQAVEDTEDDTLAV